MGFSTTAVEATEARNIADVSALLPDNGLRYGRDRAGRLVLSRLASSDRASVIVRDDEVAN